MTIYKQDMILLICGNMSLHPTAAISGLAVSDYFCGCAMGNCLIHEEKEQPVFMKGTVEMRVASLTKGIPVLSELPPVAVRSDV